MKGWRRKTALALTVGMLIGMSGCRIVGKDTSFKNPVSVTVWNYYNGDQLLAFEQLVAEFNDTVGREKNIVVLSVSQGSIDNLANSLMDAVQGKVGAQNVPTLAAVYPETAYGLNEMGKLVPIETYFTTEELSAYVPSFVEDGRLKENGDIMLFPVSKSTEVFIVNETDWKVFEEAGGVKATDVTTYEQLLLAAEQYYEWTDSLTPDVLEDGKALYGRDSIANYVYIGSMQLGHDLFTITDDGVAMDLDRDTFKVLWDNYYVPFINGYYGAYAKFRSEDAKTGSILALTGSSSGMSYIPTAVTLPDDTTHNIEISVSKPLVFEQAKEKIYVQQGAGYCIFDKEADEEKAAAVFLKWFTESDRNLQFSLLSGYSPVTRAANEQNKIKDSFDSANITQKQQNQLNALLISSDLFLNDKTYTSKPFETSRNVRDILGEELENAAVRDRAEVLARIAAGMTRQEAVADFVTDEYFDKWFEGLYQKIEAEVK